MRGKVEKAMELVSKNLEAGPYSPMRSSLMEYRVPEWYRDAKFGIFIHWGVYSVPAFDSEWYPRNMYIKGQKAYEHHIKTYGPQDKFGYKDFIPMFKAEHFNADKWVDLFCDAGARYVVPVAEHHDGFAMYDSAFTKWTAKKMGPKRDLIGELVKSIRKRGLRLGLSNHRIEHWFFMEGGMEFASDVRDPRWADLYGPAKPMDSPFSEALGTHWLDEWLVRCCEAVDKYEPDLFYFDWWINYHMAKEHLRRFTAYFYNHAAQRNQGAVVNYKYEALPYGAAVQDFERFLPTDIRSDYWQLDTAVAKNSWCHIENIDYKTASSLIHDLVDVVSKNGNLLLNIGPRADGIIPDGDKKLLLGIGKWLKINGEGIYGTRPWKVFGEGPAGSSAKSSATVLPCHEGNLLSEADIGAYGATDIRFTSKGSRTLYAICLGWPDKSLLIRSLGSHLKLYKNDVKDVQLLGYNGKLKWERNAEGLKIDFPERRPCEHAFTLKIQA